MQDALLHLQCVVPPDEVDTHMVNTILIGAAQSTKPQALVVQQCLDVLQDRGLPWNATTWHQVLRLQARLIMHYSHLCKHHRLVNAASMAHCSVL